MITLDGNYIETGDDPWQETCYQKWLDELEGTNRKMKQFKEDRDGGKMDNPERRER